MRCFKHFPTGYVLYLFSLWGWGCVMNVTGCGIFFLVVCVTLSLDTLALSRTGSAQCTTTDWIRSVTTRMRCRTRREPRPPPAASEPGPSTSPLFVSLPLYSTITLFAVWSCRVLLSVQILIEEITELGPLGQQSSLYSSICTTGSIFLSFLIKVCSHVTSTDLSKNWFCGVYGGIHTAPCYCQMGFQTHSANQNDCHH